MKKPAKIITDGLEIIDQAIYLGKPIRAGLHPKPALA
jgi:hypothetical protein